MYEKQRKLGNILSTGTENGSWEWSQLNNQAIKQPSNQAARSGFRQGVQTADDGASKMSSYGSIAKDDQEGHFEGRLKQ